MLTKERKKEIFRTAVHNYFHFETLTNLYSYCYSGEEILEFLSDISNVEEVESAAKRLWKTVDLMAEAIEWKEKEVGPPWRKVIVTTEMIEGDRAIQRKVQRVYEGHLPLLVQAHYDAVTATLEDKSFSEMVDEIHDNLFLEEGRNQTE